MTRDLSLLSSRAFDLLVVGGGIYGLAAAYDAALRGFEVALVEREDFGAGASFNHLKTIHGGLRYLQHGDLKRVLQSIRERRALARMAPHLLAPLPFIMATRGVATRSRAAMAAAFALDAAIGCRRNAGVPPHLRLPRGRVLPLSRCPRRFIEMTPPGVSGAAVWNDYQTWNSERLTLSFALGAAASGAVLANYVEATGATREGRRVTGATVRDRLSGDEFRVRARVTLNTAGASASRMTAAFGVRFGVPLIKAMNLVTSRPAEEPAIGSPTLDGRLLFLVPWRGRALVGTSHSRHLVEPGSGRPTVSETELAGFLQEANEAFPALRLQRDEVRLVHRGLVPAARGRDGSFELAARTIFRDHATQGIEGAITVVGVKYTTARGVAERAVDLVAAKLGSPSARSTTAATRLPGATDDVNRVATALLETEPGLPEDVARHLVETYGTDARLVLHAADDHVEARDRLDPFSPVIAAEVIHAVRREMACRLADIVVRRTPLGLLGHPGAGAVKRAAAVMARECGWSRARVEEEVAAVDGFYGIVPG
ncbi:MAG: FAD-dependent oxidoreductase [Vicinamibacterales bacterium]